MTDDSPDPLIDTSVSHSARVWNYWLGGKDFYPVDREAGDRVAEMYPDIVLDPGVVSTPRWRPHVTAVDGAPREVDQFCAVARKP